MSIRFRVIANYFFLVFCYSWLGKCVILDLQDEPKITEYALTAGRLGTGAWKERPAGLRTLMQAAGVAEIVTVTTPAELKAAVSQGFAHIEIQEHLDLRTVAPQDTAGDQSLLGGFKPQSIRVCFCYIQNCDTCICTFTCACAIT